jgi:hypothetical protein
MEERDAYFEDGYVKFGGKFKEAIDAKLRDLGFSPGKGAIEKHIKCFNGKLNGNTLMDKKTYDYVLKLTAELIDTKKCPQGIKPIERISGLPFKFINRTYYNLHGEIEGSGVSDEWIKFIHRLFKNFTTMNKINIKKGFSRYDNGNYDTDKARIISY